MPVTNDKIKFQNGTKNQEQSEKVNLNKSSPEPIGQNSAACPINTSCKPLTREEIKTALNRVYNAETKPVQVGGIRTRTGIALMLIMIGTVIISSTLTLKFIALELTQIIFGLILLLIAFILGFAISTVNIRKIYISMSRYKDKNTYAYRRIFPSSKWRAQALVYATLICLVFLGVQSLNLLVIDDTQTSTNDQADFEEIKLPENMPFIEDVTIFQPYMTTGQNYMKTRVKINNTAKFYSEDLILEVQSQFTGIIVDRKNITLSDKNKNEFDIYIKIHEPDDTSILVLLIYRDKVGEQSFDRYFIQSKNDIYIAAVSYKVDHKPIPIGNSIEITVKVFNEGGLRDPNDVELILSSQSLFPHYDKRASNNDTIYKKEFWTYTFEIDNVFDDEWKFDIELRLNDEVRDEAMVYSD